MSDVRVFESIESLSEAAANELVELAYSAVRDRGVCHVALSGGSTPKLLFQLLAQRGRTGAPWDAIHLWWGDERTVPPDHADSNFRMTKEALIDPLRLTNVHRIRGEADDPAAAAAEYARELAGVVHVGEDRWPTFDYVMLGMGSDGHTASLFPDSPALDAITEVVVAHEVNSPLTRGPAKRITLTANAINWGRQVRFLVAGADKAAALYQVLFGGRDPKHYPAQLIAPINGHLAWFVDMAAADQLGVRPA